ncbi:MAG: hypothetical protein GX596_01915 [Propionibacterium sp.]|nr:hypothetical protein [Propionibacterium sp.]
MTQADDDPYDEVADAYDPDAPDAGAVASPSPEDFAPGQFRGHQPLGADDPSRVGDFWLDSRVVGTPAGVAYTAHEEGGDSVLLLLLNDGAAADPAARSRFSGEVNAMHIDTVVARGGQDQDEGRMKVRFRPEDDDPSLQHLPPRAPWVALAFDGSERAVGEATRVFHAVDLQTAAPLSRPAGPDYKLHWIDRTKAGTTRLWPLSWPGRRDRAGWISVFVSWLIMLLLAALGLLLAILAFQNAPLVSPPPPVPSEATGSGEGGSGSPQEGTPTEGGGAPPDDEFTPTMGEPDDEGTEGGGEPTVNRRL